MKCYGIGADREAVASFTMDYVTFIAKFRCSRNLVEFILQNYPEYKDLTYDADFPNDHVVVTFYSIGDVHIVEEKV